MKAPFHLRTRLRVWRSIAVVLAVGPLFAVHAQQPDALATLTTGGNQPWKVIGNAAAPKCAPGDATYTFSAKQVVVGQCTGGAWTNRTEPMDTWSANGKSGIAFGGARYEVKALPASAPACKGNATCVRLATVPDGKSDATRTLYLTR